MGKRIVLSDSSLNRYGYRVLTEGINIETFKKNPVMLYMHYRDEGTPLYCDYKAIGHWEDIQIDGDQLSAVPVFDKVDELSETISKKFEAGTFNAASIGIRILETSSDKAAVVQGQTRETVTKCDLMEASIVDVPANANAVRLYDKSNCAKLAAGLEDSVVPALKQEEKMNLKSSLKAVLAFLGIEPDKAENTELSQENLEKLNAEMERLQAENAALQGEKATAEGQLKSAQEENATLKAEQAKKDAEIAALKEQVENLTAQPAPAPAIAPKAEPVAEEKDDLAAFCEKTEANDYAAFTAKLKEEGLI